MTDAYLFRLKKNREYLLRDLEPRKVLNYLYQEDVIDADDRDDVKSERTRKSQAEALLDMLERRGPNAVHYLVKGLQKSPQKYLADFLNKPSANEDTVKTDCVEIEETMSAIPSLDSLACASGRTKAISPEKKTKKENETKNKKRKRSPESNDSLKRFKDECSANRMAISKRLSSNTCSSSNERNYPKDCVKLEEGMTVTPALDPLASASGWTKAISPELNDALKRVDCVKGFGIGEEKLVIHVLEGYEKEATKLIDKILREHPFDGEHLIETFYKDDYIEFHSVGGHRLDVSSFGTIGCFLRFKDAENHDRIYAVTCHHVANPGKMQTMHLLDKKLPADIAFIPKKNWPKEYQFEQDKRNLLMVNPRNLKKNDEVEKRGAATNLTRGKIAYPSYGTFIDGEYFQNLIVVESSDDINSSFSEPGDSGSLVTFGHSGSLVDNDETETPKVVSMLFAGGRVGGRKRSFTFAFKNAIDKLKERYGISGDLEIFF